MPSATRDGVSIYSAVDEASDDPMWSGGTPDRGVIGGRRPGVGFARITYWFDPNRRKE